MLTAVKRELKYDEEKIKADVKEIKVDEENVENRLIY